MDKVTPDMPAFPNTLSTIHDKPGMSLRQYFAGQALAGFLANPELTGPNKELDAPGRLALACVTTADQLIAMLAETPSLK